MVISRLAGRGGWEALLRLGCVVLLAGCATKAQTPFPQEQILRGEPLDPADAEYVTAAYRIVQLDNAEGQLAATQSGDPAVRALAADFVAKANQLYPLLEEAIERNGITPPRELPADLRARVDRLRSKRGRAFDQQYLSDQIETHERTIQAFQMEQARTRNPSMRRLVDIGLPVIQEDLGKLRALQAG